MVDIQGKQHCKYLIGIAPQGVVTFISEGWGGRVSDKHIMEHAGYWTTCFLATSLQIEVLALLTAWVSTVLAHICQHTLKVKSSYWQQK